MTALTTQDVGTGYLLVGIVVGLVGAGLIWLSQSLWSERQARKAERTVAETPQQREDRLWDAQIDQSLRIAEHEAMAHARLAPVADVVPIRIPSQRRGGAS